MLAGIKIRSCTVSERVGLLQRGIQSKDTGQVSKVSDGVPQLTRHSQLQTMAVLQGTFDLGQQRFVSMLIESVQRNAGGNKGGGKLLHCKSDQNVLIHFNLAGKMKISTLF